MRRIGLFFRSLLGFITVTAVSFGLVVWLADGAGAPMVNELGKVVAAVLGAVAGFFGKVIYDINNLRDVEGLNKAERVALRSKLVRTYNSAWAWIMLLTVVGAMAFFATPLVNKLGTPILWLYFMLITWAVYSLVILAGWLQEIAEFKSLLHDRKQRKAANDDLLKSIDKTPEWQPIEKLKKFTDDPPPGNHACV